MININSARSAFVAGARKVRRDEAISLKRNLNSILTQSAQNEVDLSALFNSILTNSTQSYSQLASLSIQPSVTSLLISEGQAEPLFHVIDNLDSLDPIILQNALIILGHISHNQRAEQLMNYDIIPSLLACLSHKKGLIRELATWVLVNIASEQESYATLILNNIALIDKLSQMLLNDISKIKLETLYLFRNLIENGQTNRLVEYLSDDDLFIGIRTVIKQQSKQFQTLALQILRSIIVIGDEISENGVNMFSIKMDKLGLSKLFQDQLEMIEEN